MSNLEPSSSLSPHNRLIQLADATARGEAQARSTLLAEIRGYLKLVVKSRMSNQLRQRLDESDIVQDAMLTIDQRIDDFLVRQPLPLIVWIRQSAYESLITQYRRHVGAASRSVLCELPERSSRLLANILTNDTPNPLERLVANERLSAVQLAMEHLDEQDREIIVLRIHEGLSNSDAAAAVGVSDEAASKRFARALIRLRAKLTLS